MDEFDRKIIQALMSDSKFSYQQLAERVNLSPSACFRRVHALQDSGVIERFTIQLNSRALGYAVTAFVEVRVNRQDQEQVNQFKSMLNAQREVVSCHQLTGNTDFLLQICTESIEKYTQFIEEELLSLRAVRDVSSSIVLSEIKPYSPRV